MLSLPGNLIALEVGDERVEWCGKLLAWLGVRVIKVEPREGSTSRALPPLTIDRGDRVRSFHWESWNEGKESVRLDTGTEAGRAVLDALIRRADVVLVGLDDPAAVGLDGERIVQLNPRAVHADLSPFGRSGPYADRQATDGVVLAMSGYMWLSGRPDGAPVVAPGSQAYLIGGTQAAVAVAMALRARGDNGPGDSIEIAAMEAAAAQENIYSAYSLRAEVITRNGSQHRAAAPGRIYACKDGYVHMYVGTQIGVWPAFTRWIGDPPELRGEEWLAIRYRLRPENRAIVDRLTDEFCISRRRDDVVEQAQALHIPIVPVLTMAEATSVPHATERGVMVTIDDDGLGTLSLVAPPWRDDGEEVQPTAAPALGEHTVRVLRELAGIDDDGLRALHAALVI